MVPRQKLGENENKLFWGAKSNGQSVVLPLLSQSVYAIQILSLHALRNRYQKELSMHHCQLRLQLFAFSLILVMVIVPWIVWGTDTPEGPGTSVPLQGNTHIASPDAPHIPYNSNPPTSGPHVNFIARWGIHSTPVPKEFQVHNLEDGGVVIQYNCKNCQDLVSKLEQVAKRYDRILLAPYPDMDTTIALTAWGKIDKLSQFDENRITRFIEVYIGIDHHPKEELDPTTGQKKVPK
jgi:hypothetical protein